MKVQHKRCEHCDGQGFRLVPAPMELRRRREASGLSLREVARRLDLSPPYISDMELGARRAMPEVVGFYESLKVKRKRVKRTPRGFDGEAFAEEAFD